MFWGATRAGVQNRTAAQATDDFIAASAEELGLATTVALAFPC